MNPDSETKGSDSMSKSKQKVDLPPESEAAKNGGVEAAKQKAERDWEDSSKEEGS